MLKKRVFALVIAVLTVVVLVLPVSALPTDDPGDDINDYVFFNPNDSGTRRYNYFATETGGAYTTNQSIMQYGYCVQVSTAVLRDAQFDQFVMLYNYAGVSYAYDVLHGLIIRVSDSEVLVDDLPVISDPTDFFIGVVTVWVTDEVNFYLSRTGHYGEDGETYFSEVSPGTYYPLQTVLSDLGGFVINLATACVIAPVAVPISYDYFVGESNGLQQGYVRGTRDGYSDGYDVGYADGLNDVEAGALNAYQTGYSAGLTEGIAEGGDWQRQNESTSLGMMVSSVFSSVVRTLKSLTSFEILGVNIWNFLTVIVGIIIAIAVFFSAKKAIGGK